MNRQYWCNASNDLQTFKTVLQKRRSARNTKRKKYNDDLDLDLSDDDLREPHEIDTDSAVQRPVSIVTLPTFTTLESGLSFGYMLCV